MAYRKLSDLVAELDLPQQSDTFIKLFRAAVIDEKIDAFQLSERVTVPRTYKRRGEAGTYQRQAREMIFEETPAVQKWFQEVQKQLAEANQHGRGGRSRPVQASLETVESGEFDFQAAVAETRRKMQQKYDRGQALGNSRGRNQKTKKK